MRMSRLAELISRYKLFIYTCRFKRIAARYDKSPFASNENVREQRRAKLYIVLTILLRKVFALGTMGEKLQAHIRNYIQQQEDFESTRRLRSLVMKNIFERGQKRIVTINTARNPSGKSLSLEERIQRDIDRTE